MAVSTNDVARGPHGQSSTFKNPLRILIEWLKIPYSRGFKAIPIDQQRTLKWAVLSHDYVGSEVFGEISVRYQRLLPKSVAVLRIQGPCTS